MRYLAKTGKPIAILLCAILIAPAALTALVSTAAYGQYVSPPKWRVGVLDFSVGEGVRGAPQDVEAKVAQRMYLSLKETRRYELVSPRELENAIASLGIAPPYEPGEMKLLCESLNLDGLVRGTITGLSVDGSKRASVSLSAVIWDPVAEENVNGGEATSVSPAHPGFTGEPGVILDAVVGEVCTEVAKTLASRPIITGTILVIDAFGNVFINIGEHQGLKAGMMAVALERRFDEATKKEYHARVGMLRIVRVGPKEATAKVVDQVGAVRETNDVRVVYERPLAAGAVPMVEARTNTRKIILTLAVLYVLVGALMNRDAAINAITSIQAQAAGTLENAVQVQWTPRSNLPTEPGVIGSEVLGYIVYRSENPYIEGDYTAMRKLLLGSRVSRFIDDARPELAVTTIQVDDNGVLSITAGTTSAATTTTSATTTTTALTTTTAATARAAAGQPAQAVSVSKAGLTRQGYTNTLEVNVDSLGVVPGVHYYYAVQCVSKFQVYGGSAGGALVIGAPITTTAAATTTTSAGTTTTAQTTTGQGTAARLGGSARMGQRSQNSRQNEIARRFVVALSDWSKVFGPVTPLARPTLISPAGIPEAGSSDVSPYGADFRWNSVAGADTYVLQVANNLQFTSAYTSPETFAAGEVAGVLMTQRVSIFDVFATAQPRYYYWRVGARYSGDQLRPAPDGYVWSERRSFQTVELPPPPPG